MPSNASATEIELETEDEDGTVNTVYCKVGELVSVRRLAQHSNLKRTLPFLPGVIAGIALFFLGHWILALIMAFIGGIGLGWVTGQPLLTDDLGLSEEIEADPFDAGLVGQPAAVTTLQDGIEATSVDIDEIKQKLGTADIDFQEYVGSFENTYQEIEYEYLIVPSHVTEVSVDDESVHNVRNTMVGFSVVFAIVIFVITRDPVSTIVPAGLFAVSSAVLPSAEMPTMVTVETAEPDDLESTVQSYRRFLLSEGDAETFASNIRSGTKTELESEGDVFREGGDDSLDPGYRQPDDFAADLDSLQERMASNSKTERSTASSDLSDGARKYPDVAIPAIPAAIDALDDSYDLTRQNAVQTLHYIADVRDELSSDDVERIVSALVDRLDDADEKVRNAAVHALAEWAEADAATVRSHLADILAAGTAPIQAPADPHDEGMLAALTSTIEANSEHVRLRRGLIRLLTAIAEDDPERVAENIRDRLDAGQPPTVTSIGLQVLANIAREHPDAVTVPAHFDTYLTNDAVRFDALFLANELAVEHPEKLEPYASGLNAVLETQPIDHDSAMDNRTVNAIGALASLAEYDPDLIRDPASWMPDCLTHSAAGVRGSACVVLAALGRNAVPDSFDLEPILRRLLTDDERGVREAACRAVAAIGIEGLEAELEQCRDDDIPSAETALEAPR
ncbi:HEAT repeat domain-containing protein [Natronomonas sp. F2-12]|jgi:hypothetical protein|uniref:HEAT repeat domain-containing protein n=1 Tax=Natronomonas aquatica TaxID=2841590 RepID=A0A9R1D3V7_9EURY|nr:HEAT repeat domain-containing protein [Natronomonas aquatica]MCQ4332714.1 HEAT repeat domain-containing protein [Natronomonas aquatica]